MIDSFQKMLTQFMTLLLVAVPLHCQPTLTDADADLITDLPGLNFTTNYRQYSGYLQPDNTTFLHYWFTESQNAPSTDPLLLWLNGGPGCSSLDGLLSELGPLHVNLHSDGSTSLYENPHSWNTFANVLFLEAPACVGFSYSTDSCSASDETTYNKNYLALQQFFERFPAFKANPLYITGESYGGVYVPSLTRKIIDGLKDYPLNLKGFAVGNGLSSYAKNTDSMMFFAYYHGLIGQTAWTKMVNACCTDGVPSKDACDFANSNSYICQGSVRAATNALSSAGLNMYDIYGDCAAPSAATVSSSFSREHAEKYALFHHITEKNVGLDPPCIDSAPLNDYLNNADVRKALHIPASVGKWEICSAEVNLHYQRQFMDMTTVYQDIHAAGVRGLVYNGDVDMACNYLGDQWFVEDLQYEVLEARRAWKWDGQVGGYVKKFKLLDLLTVRGSGHMVPQNKPAPALHMIKSFVQNTPY